MTDAADLVRTFLAERTGVHHDISDLRAALAAAQAGAPNDSFVAGLKAAAKAAQTAYAEARDSEWDDGFNDARTIIANAIRALLPPAAPANDRCARCGHSKREHHHDGACYGLCGEFVAPSASEPAGAWTPHFDFHDESRWPPQDHPLYSMFHDARLGNGEWNYKKALEYAAEPAGLPSDEDVARALCCPWISKCLHPRDCHSGEKTLEKDQTKAIMVLLQRRGK